MLLRSPPLMIVGLVGACSMGAAQRSRDCATVERSSRRAGSGWREAVPLAEKALAIYEKVLGPEHPTRSKILARASVLYVSARHRSRSASARSFANYEKALGPGNTRGLVSGRAFLLTRDREPQGYGAIQATYCSRHRQRAQRARCVESYLVLVPMAELERHKRRSHLNVTSFHSNELLSLPPI